MPSGFINNAVVCNAAPLHHCAPEPCESWANAAPNNGFLNTTLTPSSTPVTTSGTYSKVTVNDQGLVTGGSGLAAGDVSAALGYTPVSAAALANVQVQSVTITGTNVIQALGYTPANQTALAGLQAPTVNAATISAALGYTPLQHNEPISSATVVQALGYTPLQSNQPLTFTAITTGLGYTPLQHNEPLTTANVVAAIGYTPLQNNQPLTSAAITTGLGYTPLSLAANSALLLPGNLNVAGTVNLSQNNASGGGIILSDDGDIVDLNTGYASMRFTSGVQVYSANKGGTPAIYLKNTGEIVSQNPATGLGRATLNAGGAGGRSWTVSSYGQDQGAGAGWFAVADETAGAVRLRIDTNGIMHGYAGIEGQTVDGFGFGLRAVASASSGNAILQYVNSAANAELGNIHFDTNSQLHVVINGLEMIGLNATRGLYLNPADNNVALRFHSGGAAYIQNDAGQTISTFDNSGQTLFQGSSQYVLTTQAGAGTGQVRLACGDTNHPGYVAFYNPDQTTRSGYIGWSKSTAGDRLMLQSEGASGWQINGPVAFGTGIVSSDVQATFLRQDGANEGGELHLQQPVNGGGTNGDYVLDANQNFVRIFEAGGSNRGVRLDLTACSPGVGTNLLNPPYTAPSSTVVRTSADKFNEIISLADYGYVGGNVRADTDSLGKAISAAYARGVPGARIFIPPTVTPGYWDGQVISSVLSASFDQGAGISIFGVRRGTKICPYQVPTSTQYWIDVQDAGLDMSDLFFLDNFQQITHDRSAFRCYGAQTGSGNSGDPLARPNYYNGLGFQGMAGTAFTIDGADGQIWSRIHTVNVRQGFYFATGGIDCTIQDSLLFNVQTGVYFNTPGNADTSKSHTEGAHVLNTKIFGQNAGYDSTPGACVKVVEGLWIRLTNVEGVNVFGNNGVGLDMEVPNPHGAVMVQDMGCYWEGGPNGACIKISGNAQRFRKIGGYLSNGLRSNVQAISLSDSQATVDIDCEAAPLLGSSWGQGYCYGNTSYANRLRIIPYPGDSAPPISTNMSYATS